MTDISTLKEIILDDRSILNCTIQLSEPVAAPLIGMSINWQLDEIDEAFGLRIYYYNSEGVIFSDFSTVNFYAVNQIFTLGRNTAFQNKDFMCNRLVFERLGFEGTARKPVHLSVLVSKFDDEMEREKEITRGEFFLENYKKNNS